MRLLRPFVKTVGGVSHRVRDTFRLQQVATVMVKHGFGALLTNIDVPGLGRIPSRFEGTPERLTHALQELGPTFIKLGQVLSTRPDILPDIYIEALQTLQDDVEPVPFPAIEKQLAAELGAEWRSLVKDFDDTPLATASIAQVHPAILADGQQVVFKVQRPGIAKQIRSDLNILALLASRAIVEFPETERLDPKGVLHEFERSILGELDFDQEAQAMDRFRRNFADTDFVRIPEVVAELTTPRVLCVEYLDGVKIREARARGKDMALVGERYLHVAYTMLFEHGAFHGDLHPGNVLVLEDEVLGLLDFGMVGALTRDMRDALVSLLFALERGDQRTIARIFYDIAVKEERVDYAAFERDVMAVVERNWVAIDSVADMQIGRFLMDVTQGAIQHRVRAPHGYTMFFKALLTTEGLAKSLIPEVDPLKAAQPYVKRLVAERYGQDRIKEDLFYTGVTFNTLSQRIPVSLSQLLDDIDNQRLQLNVRQVYDRESDDAADRRQNRVIIASFAVTAVVCGTLALDVQLWGFSWLTAILYSAAAPMFLLALTMALRNRG
mgnify:CR=1 FL=1